MGLSQRRSTSPLGTFILMLNRRPRYRNTAGQILSHHSRPRHPCPAAHTAQQPRREPRAVVTAYGHGYRGGHLGSLQRPYETMLVNPSDLLLALDAPSAGGTGTRSFGTLYGRIQGPGTRVTLQTVPSGPPRAVQTTPRRVVWLRLRACFSFYFYIFAIYY